jgi:hypothetical protein
MSKDCDICFEQSDKMFTTHCKKQICVSCCQHVQICPFCRKEEGFLEISSNTFNIKVKELTFSDFVYKNKLYNCLFVCIPKDKTYQMEFCYYERYLTPPRFILKFIRTYASAYLFIPVNEYEIIIDKKKLRITFNEDRGKEFNYYQVEFDDLDISKFPFDLTTIM